MSHQQNLGWPSHFELPSKTEGTAAPAGCARRDARLSAACRKGKKSDVA